MPACDREQLIRRKLEVIQEQAVLRRQLAAPSTGARQRASLEADLQRLQTEERHLRLAIDRVPPKSTIPHLQSKENAMQTQFDALITAGYDRNKPDPLTAMTHQPHKVLVEVANKPMIWHVVRALAESEQVGEIVIVGLDAEQTPDFGRSVDYVADQGTLFANLSAGLNRLATLNNQNRYVFTTTGDTPLLTGEMLRWFVEACRPLDKDAYWGIVSRPVMETTFPRSKRSYMRLREGNFCSGDLFLFDLQKALGIQPILDHMLATRKNVVQQLRFLGIGTIIRFLFRRLSLAWLLDLAERKMDIKGMAVQIPFAEAGMDVDKPHQLQQVLDYLSNHPEHPAHTRSRIEPC